MIKFLKKLFRVRKEVSKLGMTREEAEEFVKKAFDRLPREARRRAIKKLRKKGYDIS